MSRQRGSSGTLFLVLGALVLAAVGYLFLQDSDPGPVPPGPAPSAGTPPDPVAPAPAPLTGPEPVRESVRLGDPGAARSELPAEAGESGTVFGMVMDQQSVPVAGARVMLTESIPAVDLFSAEASGELRRFAKVTNKDGRYWFDRLPVGRDFDMWVYHPSFAAATGTAVHVLPIDQTVPPVVLDLGYEIFGQVTDTGGNPLAAKLRFELHANFQLAGDRADEKSEDGRRLEILADADGRYRASRLMAGIWRLTAGHEGYADHLEPAIVVGGDQFQIEKDLSLGSEYRIAGSVRDESGEAVPNPKVFVARSRPRPPSQAEALGDEAGRFEVRGLPEGIYGLAVEAPGYSRSQVPRVEAGTLDLDVVLYRRGSVSGRVTEPAGRPVAAFDLELVAVNRGTSVFHQLGQIVTFRSATGDYLYTDVEPGSYRLLVTAPGFSPSYSPGFTVDRQEVQGIDVRMAIGGSLSGTVLGPEGEPLAGAEILLHGRDWSEQNAFGLFGGRSPDPNNVPEQSTRSDRDGRFAMSNAFPGPLRVEFRHPTCLSEFLNLEVSEGSRQDVGVIRLRRGGAVFGVGVRPDGSPLAGGSAFITRQDEGSFPSYSANSRLDVQGRFRFDALRSGSYQVSVTGADSGAFSLFAPGEGNTRVVYVAEGKEVEVRLIAD